MRGRRFGAATGAALVALVVGVGCGADGPSAFCRDLRELHEAGPLFPPRTDGEPVPDPGVLALLRGVSERAPSEIADDVGVLVREAEALAAAAQERGPNGSSSPQTGRLSRSVVESAQRAVLDYADDTCDIDLTRVPEA